MGDIGGGELGYSSWKYQRDDIGENSDPFCFN